jgi:hypothetical protein
MRCREVAKYVSHSRNNSRMIEADSTVTPNTCPLPAPKLCRSNWQQDRCYRKFNYRACFSHEGYGLNGHMPGNGFHAKLSVLLPSILILVILVEMRHGFRSFLHKTVSSALCIIFDVYLTLFCNSLLKSHDFIRRYTTTTTTKHTLEWKPLTR